MVRLSQLFWVSLLKYLALERTIQKKSELTKLLIVCMASGHQIVVIENAVIQSAQYQLRISS
jgi:hypothetical protein